MTTSSAAQVSRSILANGQTRTHLTEGIGPAVVTLNCIGGHRQDWRAAMLDSEGVTRARLVCFGVSGAGRPAGAVGCAGPSAVRRTMFQRLGHRTRVGLAGLLCIFAGAAMAQEAGLPPIFKDTPVSLRQARTVAELPKNTFLENLVVDAKGVVFVNSHLDGTVYRYGPDHKLSKFASVPGKIAGIALDSKGRLVVSGADDAGQAALYRIDAQGKAQRVASLPQAIFLNGLVRQRAEVYLVADSYKGVIWRVDLARGAVAVWLQHELLSRTSEQNPTPGVNGIKIDKGRVLVSNTARQLLIGIDLNANDSAGALQMLHQSLNIDDFAIDTDGSILAATHVYNSLIRIAPDGAISTIAGPGQGMVGSTAVAFGRAPGDRRQLYVTTNGGMFLPPPSGVGPGRLVRVSLDLLQ
jgi:sugar lactone lactonase YvrE